MDRCLTPSPLAWAVCLSRAQASLRPMCHLPALPLERKARSMIRRMTGFARRQTAWQDGSVTVEVRSVDHRFLEEACRRRRSLNHLAETFKKVVQQRCTRGRVDLAVSLQGGKGKVGTVSLDQSLAKQYHHTLRTLKKSLKLRGAIDLSLIAGLRDVLSVSDQPPEDPKLGKLVVRLVGESLD